MHFKRIHALRVWLEPPGCASHYLKRARTPRRCLCHLSWFVLPLPPPFSQGELLRVLLSHRRQLYDFVIAPLNVLRKTARDGEQRGQVPRHLNTAFEANESID